MREEVLVLEKFGLRWAILAAWSEELDKRGVGVGPLVGPRLNDVRTKLAAGAFSSCEVGCDLTAIEGILTAKDAESPVESVDFWLGLLGEAMAETPATEELLRYPPIKFHYMNCGLSCACKPLES
jgi:hypothetical protein